ncbi:hypothetical protein [Acidithiobacillus ferrooxidans]|uniref:hypothetical protein n=1 Tax=Acidithiobacillus ferrooxidans TaxID=920 RepID=UPI000A6DA536|nr:hypothetical protein [Acidithiobacillus ferrooxidans]
MSQTPYMVGRRASLSAASPPAASLRAEDSERSGALRMFGWSAATFGAGAILGWIAAAKKAKP